MSSPKDKATKEFKWLAGPIAAYGVAAGGYFAMYHGSFTWFSWHPLMMFISFFTLAANATLLKKIGG